MLTIRFARLGKRNMSQFKIVLQEKTAAPRGRHVEILGSYNPHKKETVLKEDRIDYWIKQGVEISDSVYNLFIKKGLISGRKRTVKITKKVKEETEEKKEGKAEEEAKGEADPEAKGENKEKE